MNIQTYELVTITEARNLLIDLMQDYSKTVYETYFSNSESKFIIKVHKTKFYMLPYRIIQSLIWRHYHGKKHNK